MAENNGSDTAPAKKGRLKLIILLVIIVILAIALSVVGTLWFLRDDASTPDTGGENGEEAAEEVFVPSTYLDLEKPLVTTVQAEGRQRYAQVYVSLEASAPQALAAAKVHLPLIRSRLVMVLGSSQFTDLQTPEGRRALADTMLDAVNQVLEQEGQPAVTRVLFRNFVVQ